MNLPPYSTFPNIIGDTITLRQIERDDINDIIPISFYDAVQANTAQEAVVMQDKINRDYTNGDSIHWGIAECVSNTIVGTCGYYRGFKNNAGELGCVLLPQQQGKGFMTRAMLMAINFGFDTIGLQRIWAETSVDNHSAINLFERLNFTVAGQDNNSVIFELHKDSVNGK